MPNIPQPGSGAEGECQSIYERGLFTTTGAVHIRRKNRPPTLRAKLEAFHKAKESASHLATLVCASNPNCPGVEFVKYMNLKEYGVAELLMLELTIQWHCKESGKE